MQRQLRLLPTLSACLGIGILLLLGRSFLGPREVGVIRTRRGPAVEAVYATGTVEPVKMVSLAIPTSSRLLEFYADEGDVVESTSRLARLDTADLEKTVEEQGIRKTYLEQEVARVSKLHRVKAASDQDLDKARTDALAQQALLERSRATLRQMELSAPNECRVIRRNGEVGELIPAQTALFVLDCGGGYRVTTEVDEEEIPRLATGTKVLLHADAFPDEVFESTISSITPQGDPLTRSFRVRSLLPSGSPLRIGMTVEVNFVISERQNALLIPSSALSDNSVWIVEEGRLKNKAVVRDVEGASAVSVRDGLAENDLIVLQPSADLQEGERVRSVIQDWQP